eukprot:CAMPEP_0201118324 /NCGR_PEP_ID=MMETSP0850-20130426/2470_1 /ASSEMBLY_ACC=CAM_ASM_000622 /TAXON_ID=183588 /ORGANISM="Pseudo-nitzschia fraudulenta, Strain WWA7" /LENGTH=221 /DNA_ID=CAMNT_0047383445 /DNA_START=96 /DNA_END=761 /DNA_ORIENTATION=-
MAVKQNSILDDISYTTPVLDAEPLTKNPSFEGDKPEEELIDITKAVAEEDKHLVEPAGVGAAVIGFIFGGPILSALLGFGSAYAVRKKNGAGDAARALGELTISVQEKSTKFEEKNKVVKKTTESINKLCDDEEEKSIPFKTRAFLVSTWLSMANFTKEKQLLERGVEGTGKGFEFIGQAFEKTINKKPKQENDDLVFVTTDETQEEEESEGTELNVVVTE